MRDMLRERLMRTLEGLPEEQLYQVLDYVEFLGSKYNRTPVRGGTPLQRFGDRLEDRMRLNGVGFSAIRGTLEVMGTADRVVTDLADVGRSLLKEVQDGLLPPLEPANAGPRGRLGSAPTGAPDRADGIAGRPATGEGTG